MQTIDTSIIVPTESLAGVEMIDDETGYTVNNIGTVILWHFDGEDAVQLGNINPGTSGKTIKELASRLYFGQ